LFLSTFPDSLVFLFISVFLVFQLLAASRTSHLSFFISFSFLFSYYFFGFHITYIFNYFVNITFFSCYKFFYVHFLFSFRLIFEWVWSSFVFFTSLSSVLFTSPLFLLVALHPSSRRFLFEVSCPPGSAITSSYPVVWSREGRVPFLVVVTNPFCAIHVQSSWWAIITKWTKREVLLTSSWYEPYGFSLAVLQKTCFYFSFLANVRRSVLSSISYTVLKLSNFGSYNISDRLLNISWKISSFLNIESTGTISILGRTFRFKNVQR